VELANTLGAHKHTVRGWIKGGLPTVDCTRPVLVLGSDFQSWWSKRRKVGKRPLKPGQLYCFKCRQPKAPALGMVEYAASNAVTGNLKAMCETCGTMMHRRARLAAVAAVMPDLDVKRTEAPPRLMEREHPSLNADKRMES
jgi:hypothetical protein